MRPERVVRMGGLSDDDDELCSVVTRAGGSTAGPGCSGVRGTEWVLLSISKWVHLRQSMLINCVVAVVQFKYKMFGRVL